MQEAGPGRAVLALIVLVPAFMASNFLVARSAPGIIGPHALAGQRWLLAGLLFGFLARDELRTHWRTLLADWRRLLVLGALGMWICGAWVYLAGQTTVATNMALIYALSPVLIALVSHFWLHEAFGRVQACGVALALAGVVHVVLGGRWGALAQLRFVPGDAWILGATLSWTLFSILLKRWQFPVGENARLAAISLAGVIVLLPFIVWEAWTGPLPLVSGRGLLLSLAAALVPGYAAYLGYSLLLQKLGAARAGVLLYMPPLYAAAMAWLLLGEPIRGYHLVGFLLVLPGVYLVNRRPVSA